MPKAAQSSKTVKAVKSTKSVKKTAPKGKKSIAKGLIKKKPYIEFLTAFLSIPVLISVLLLNSNSLKNINAKPTPTPIPSVNAQSGFYAEPIGTEKPVVPTSVGAPDEPCERGLGPAAISSPQENDVVTDNPVTIDISYDDRQYCAAAWSYRINGGSWSGYDDRSVALYNLPQGPIKFELRVKSIVGSEEETVTRNFTYNGRGMILIPTSQTGSDSAR